MSGIRQSIPFLSEGMSWEDWNGNMLHYFGEEPLPYYNEEHWQDFARSMNSLNTFSVFALPSPEGFDKWQDWVSSIIAVINGRTQ